MFRGISAINVDAKGRVAVPQRYREGLVAQHEAQMVVTIDTEASCLLLYPLTEWEKIEQKLEDLPSFNSAARRIQRLLMGHATEFTLDGHGRFLIPPLLREYAKVDLKSKVVLVGQGRKFEIWSDAVWQEERDVWLKENAADGGLPEELQKLSL